MADGERVGHCVAGVGDGRGGGVVGGGAADGDRLRDRERRLGDGDDDRVAASVAGRAGETAADPGEAVRVSQHVTAGERRVVDDLHLVGDDEHLVVSVCRGVLQGAEVEGDRLRIGRCPAACAGSGAGRADDLRLGEVGRAARTGRFGDDIGSERDAAGHEHHARRQRLDERRIRQRALRHDDPHLVGQDLADDCDRSGGRFARRGAGRACQRLRQDGVADGEVARCGDGVVVQGRRLRAVSLDDRGGWRAIEAGPADAGDVVDRFTGRELTDAELPGQLDRDRLAGIEVEALARLRLHDFAVAGPAGDDLEQRIQIAGDGFRRHDRGDVELFGHIVEEGNVVGVAAAAGRVGDDDRVDDRVVGVAVGPEVVGVGDCQPRLDERHIAAGRGRGHIGLVDGVDVEVERRPGQVEDRGRGDVVGVGCDVLHERLVEHRDGVGLSIVGVRVDDIAQRERQVRSRDRRRQRRRDIGTGADASRPGDVRQARRQRVGDRGRRRRPLRHGQDELVGDRLADDGFQLCVAGRLVLRRRDRLGQRGPVDGVGRRRAADGGVVLAVDAAIERGELRHLPGGGDRLAGLDRIGQRGGELHRHRRTGRQGVAAVLLELRRVAADERVGPSGRGRLRLDVRDRQSGQRVLHDRVVGGRVAVVGDDERDRRGVAGIAATVDADRGGDLRIGQGDRDRRLAAGDLVAVGGQGVGVEVGPVDVALAVGAVLDRSGDQQQEAVVAGVVVAGRLNRVEREEHVVAIGVRLACVGCIARRVGDRSAALLAAGVVGGQQRLRRGGVEHQRTAQEGQPGRHPVADDQSVGLPLRHGDLQGEGDGLGVGQRRAGRLRAAGLEDRLRQVAFRHGERQRGRGVGVGERAGPAVAVAVALVRAAAGGAVGQAGPGQPGRGRGDGFARVGLGVDQCPVDGDGQRVAFGQVKAADGERLAAAGGTGDCGGVGRCGERGRDAAARAGDDDRRGVEVDLVRQRVGQDEVERVVVARRGVGHGVRIGDRVAGIGLAVPAGVLRAGQFESRLDDSDLRPDRACGSRRRTGDRAVGVEPGDDGEQVPAVDRRRGGQVGHAAGDQQQEAVVVAGRVDAAVRGVFGGDRDRVERHEQLVAGCPVGSADRVDRDCPVEVGRQQRRARLVDRVGRGGDERCREVVDAGRQIRFDDQPRGRAFRQRDADRERDLFADRGVRASRFRLASREQRRGDRGVRNLGTVARRGGVVVERGRLRAVAFLRVVAVGGLVVQAGPADAGVAVGDRLARRRLRAIDRAGDIDEQLVAGRQVERLPGRGADDLPDQFERGDRFGEDRVRGRSAAGPGLVDAARSGDANAADRCGGQLVRNCVGERHVIGIGPVGAGRAGQGVGNDEVVTGVAADGPRRRRAVDSQRLVNRDQRLDHTDRVGRVLNCRLATGELDPGGRVAAVADVVPRVCPVGLVRDDRVVFDCDRAVGVRLSVGQIAERERDRVTGRRVRAGRPGDAGKAPAEVGVGAGCGDTGVAEIPQPGGLTDDDVEVVGAAIGQGDRRAVAGRLADRGLATAVGPALDRGGDQLVADRRLGDGDCARVVRGVVVDAGLAGCGAGVGVGIGPRPLDRDCGVRAAGRRLVAGQAGPGRLGGQAGRRFVDHVGVDGRLEAEHRRLAGGNRVERERPRPVGRVVRRRRRIRGRRPASLRERVRDVSRAGQQLRGQDRVVGVGVRAGHGEGEVDRLVAVGGGRVGDDRRRDRRLSQQQVAGRRGVGMADGRLVAVVVGEGDLVAAERAGVDGRRIGHHGGVFDDDLLADRVVGVRVGDGAEVEGVARRRRGRGAGRGVRDARRRGDRVDADQRQPGAEPVGQRDVLGRALGQVDRDAVADGLADDDGAVAQFGREQLLVDAGRRGAAGDVRLQLVGVDQVGGGEVAAALAAGVVRQFRDRREVDVRLQRCLSDQVVDDERKVLAVGCGGAADRSLPGAAAAARRVREREADVGIEQVAGERDRASVAVDDLHTAGDETVGQLVDDGHIERTTFGRPLVLDRHDDPHPVAGVDVADVAEQRLAGQVGRGDAAGERRGRARLGPVDAGEVGSHAGLQRGDRVLAARRGQCVRQRLVAERSDELDLQRRVQARSFGHDHVAGADRRERFQRGLNLPGGRSGGQRPGRGRSERQRERAGRGAGELQPGVGPGIGAEVVAGDDAAGVVDADDALLQPQFRREDRDVLHLVAARRRAERVGLLRLDQVGQRKPVGERTVVDRHGEQQVDRRRRGPWVVVVAEVEGDGVGAGVGGDAAVVQVVGDPRA